MFEQASSFAQEHLSSSKQQKVRDNTLAILAAEQYLQMMDVPVDVRASDSWNSLLRYGADVSDLKVPGLGHLECRSMDYQTGSCYIPDYLPDNRFGLLGVQLDQQQHRAYLQGFTKHFQSGQCVRREQLGPLSDLLACLSLNPETESILCLPQLLAGEMSSGWQRVEDLLETQRWKLAMAFMAAPQTHLKRVTVAKLLNLGLQLGTESVILLVTPTVEQGGDFGVRVQVHPRGSQRYLPAQLTLGLLNPSGQMLERVISGATDNFVQLPYFKCAPHEDFGIEVGLDSIAVTEFFTCQDSP
jgi:hypothetical protein